MYNIYYIYIKLYIILYIMYYFIIYYIIYILLYIYTYAFSVSNIIWTSEASVADVAHILHTSQVVPK